MIFVPSVTLLFPTSWQAHADYADCLWKQIQDKDAAIMAYRKSLSLNPTNEAVLKKLNELSGKQLETGGPRAGGIRGILNRHCGCITSTKPEV